MGFAGATGIIIQSCRSSAARCEQSGADNSAVINYLTLTDNAPERLCQLYGCRRHSSMSSCMLAKIFLYKICASVLFDPA